MSQGGMEARYWRYKQNAPALGALQAWRKANKSLATLGQEWLIIPQTGFDTGVSVFPDSFFHKKETPFVFPFFLSLGMSLNKEEDWGGRHPRDMLFQ